jgi:hypothetical protein
MGMEGWRSFLRVATVLVTLAGCANGPSAPAPASAGTTTGSDGGGGGGDGGGDGAGPCAGVPPDLDDGNPCTIDACDPAQGITHTPAAAGSACGGGGVCEVVCDGAGQCVPGAPPDLDDGNPCTIDTCDPAMGIVHAPAPAGTPCPDADPCTLETCDGASACAIVVAAAVDDGDSCTLDACDPAAGITHVACSALDLTVATTIAEATQFLYTGPDAVQTGVAAGTIDLRRAAVIRGRVRATDGSPLAGIHVEIEGHPEYGSTRTFADGMFAMAVNGGGPLVVSYQGDGFLPVARQVEVPWQDYARAADVVMTPYDG